MKLSTSRLREIIKEELFYRDFYRKNSGALLEAAEVGGATDKTLAAEKAVKAMMLDKKALDDLIGLLQLAHREADGGI